MKQEKKICFLLNWTREVDMFKNITDNLDKKDIIFIINDLNKKLLNHKFERDKILIILQKEKHEFDFLSNILHKKKFKTLISTADLPISKLTFKSFLKFLYGKTFGAFIQFLGLTVYLKKKFKRDLSYEGKNASYYEDIFVEKKISQISIKYPNGLDRNIKYFPNKKWDDVFDIFFTVSNYEKKLVDNRLPKKNTFNVGYSRFDENSSKFKESLGKEFKINFQKKTIFCCPNERIMFDQKVHDIREYLSFLKILSKEYNLIIRPHPKLQFTKPEYFNLIKQSDLKLDLKLNREIRDIFLISDLILVDYGSSVLEALYLKKKFLIYEWSNEEKFKVLFDKENCLDYLVRDKIRGNIIKAKYNNNKNLNFIDKILKDDEFQKKVNHINGLFFGEKKEIKNSLKIIKNIHYEDYVT